MNLNPLILLWDHTEKTTENGWFKLYTPKGLQQYAQNHPKEVAHLQNLLVNQYRTVWQREDRQDVLV